MARSDSSASLSDEKIIVIEFANQIGNLTGLEGCWRGNRDHGDDGDAAEQQRNGATNLDGHEKGLLVREKRPRAGRDGSMGGRRQGVEPA